MRIVLLRFLLLMAVIFLLVVITVFLASPKSTAPFTDERGQPLVDSIAEIRTIELNGFQQRLLIRGRDLSNPVLLHLHGGPGGADQAIIRPSGKTIEDMFTVVYWDQRGAGASYSSETTADSLSLDQIVEDGIRLAKQLKNEFAKEKIYLQSHSWGTLVGTHMAAKAPELFHAYLGIGQIANSKRAELLSFNYTKDQAEKLAIIVLHP